MPKPYPDPSQLNNTLDIMNYANEVTSGAMGNLFVVTCLVISFALLKVKGHRTSDSLGLASFLSLILSSLLWSVGVIQGNIVVILLVTSVGCLIWTIFDQ